MDVPRELVAVLILEYDRRSGWDDVVLVLLAVLPVLDDNDNWGLFISVEGPFPVRGVVPRRLKITLSLVHLTLHRTSPDLTPHTLTLNTGGALLSRSLCLCSLYARCRRWSGWGGYDEEWWTMSARTLLLIGGTMLCTTAGPCIS